LKQLIIVLGVLFALSFNSYSQLLNENAENTYNFIQQNYNNPNLSDSVARFTYSGLSNIGIKGDWLAYATVLVASANIDQTNDRKALFEIEKVEVSNISHLGVYFDVQLKKAQLLMYNDYLLESDSLFKIIIPDIPKSSLSLKALAHNNYALLNKVLRNGVSKDMWAANLDSANYYINLIDAQNDPVGNLKSKRLNRNFTNQGKYYLSVGNIKRAKDYFGRIDTTGSVLITKIEYLELQASLFEADGDNLAAIGPIEEILAVTSMRTYRDKFESSSNDYLRVSEKAVVDIKRKRNYKWAAFSMIFLGFIGYKSFKGFKRFHLNKELEEFISDEYVSHE